MLGVIHSLHPSPTDGKRQRVGETSTQKKPPKKQRLSKTCKTKRAREDRKIGQKMYSPHPPPVAKGKKIRP